MSILKLIWVNYTETTFKTPTHFSQSQMESHSITADSNKWPRREEAINIFPYTFPWTIYFSLEVGKINTVWNQSQLILTSQTVTYN